MVAGSIIHTRALQQHQRDIRRAVQYLVSFSGGCLSNGPTIEAKGSIQQVVADHKTAIMKTPA